MEVLLREDVQVLLDVMDRHRIDALDEFGETGETTHAWGRWLTAVACLMEAQDRRCEMLTYRLTGNRRENNEEVVTARSQMPGLRHTAVQAPRAQQRRPQLA